MQIQDLKVNQVYSNQDIRSVFQCALQGGMRRSKRTNSLVLISNHTGSSIYGDKWIDGIIHYTGMGQVGDQRLDYSQNRTLNESNENGIDVYLFEVFKDREYTFVGKVQLAGAPYQDREEDKNGNDRIVYRFPLRIVDDGYLPYRNVLNETDLIRETLVSRKQDEDLKRIAEQRSMANRGKSQYRDVKTRVFERDPFIRSYVKKLAKGICQLCENPAPFELDGEPFLHVHHIEYLADGGEDTIENSIAICPNCHERIHKLELPEDKSILLLKVAMRADN